jgi:hypothetical protein
MIPLGSVACGKFVTDEVEACMAFNRLIPKSCFSEKGILWKEDAFFVWQFQ